MPRDPRMERFFRVFTLERGLVVGRAAMLAGVALLVGAVEPVAAAPASARSITRDTMRLGDPRRDADALGFQTVLSSFFVSMLGLRRR